MLDRAAIHALIPQQGSMCLLSCAEAWSATTITCRASSHLDPGNPLRRDGRLSAICGVEYGLQAAALHGALLDRTPQPMGMVAALRRVELLVPHLDDADLGMLRIEATLAARNAQGLLYDFSVHAASGRMLLAGRAMIVLP